MRVLVAVLLLVSIGSLAGYWTFRRKAEDLCHVARGLAKHGGAVAVWIRESRADPFLGEGALRGPPNGVIAIYRDRARLVAAGVPARFLPDHAREAFARVAHMREANEALAGALEDLRPASAGLECREGDRAGAEAEIVAKIGEAERFWKDRRASAVLDRQNFANDRVIFCRAEQLLAKLRGVVAVASARCQAAKPGTKLAKSCGGGNGAGGVEAEIQDLEKEKEINLRKLRQKWPEAVVQGLRC